MKKIEVEVKVKRHRGKCSTPTGISQQAARVSSFSVPILSSILLFSLPSAVTFTCLLSCCLPLNLPVAHLDDSVHKRGLIHYRLMACYDNSSAFPVQPSHDLHKLSRELCIKMGSGFVGNKNGWVVDKGTCNGNPLGLSDIKPLCL